jgi:hypothetical protein
LLDLDDLAVWMRSVLQSCLCVGLGVFLPTAALSQANLYRCTILQSGKVSGGYLRDTNWTKGLRESMNEIIFDPVHSRLIWGKTAHNFQIVQQGSNQNSLVAVRLHQGIASFVVQTIHIQTWEKDMPFIYQDVTEVYTGTCKEI